MIEISNLRLVKGEEWTKVVVDIKSDVERIDNEETMWVAVKNENASMLNDETYDAFLCLPVIMSMYYNTDLRIHGKVSRILYHNVRKYVQSIFNFFKDGTKIINIEVDGFAEVQQTNRIVGTGISCGVDCLQTIYDNYCLEDDVEYKINGLFNFNCGWHGKYGNDETYRLFLERSMRNKQAAEDLNLPLYLVDSNLDAFLRFLGDQTSYFNLYTCAFALEKGLSKYYISGSYSYRDILRIGFKSRNRDFSEFGEPLVVALLRTENLELISDGYQYDRTEKTERIVDWDIAKKHLNVCCVNDNKENCSICGKCIRTLMALEAMDKLDDYKDIFNIAAYKKNSLKDKCRASLIGKNGNDGFMSDLNRFYKLKNKRLPSRIFSLIYLAPSVIVGRIKRLIGKKCRKEYDFNKKI